MRATAPCATSPAFTFAAAWSRMARARVTAPSAERARAFAVSTATKASSTLKRRSSVSWRPRWCSAWTSESMAARLAAMRPNSYTGWFRPAATIVDA